MIKIIKNTMTDPIQMECEDCKSVFSYNYEDIQADKETTILGTAIHKRYVCCPVCRYCNFINTVTTQIKEETV